MHVEYGRRDKYTEPDPLDKVPRLEQRQEQERWSAARLESTPIFARDAPGWFGCRHGGNAGIGARHIATKGERGRVAGERGAETLICVHLHARQLSPRDRTRPGSSSGYLFVPVRRRARLSITVLLMAAVNISPHQHVAIRFSISSSSITPHIQQGMQ